ncbi:hypothetical protein [Campylobacter sp.]|nr:hypothetical protein [Campylobacter sp.]MDD7090871.1 hypothetical protein [Campylobacteraceae bacterium]MDY5285175.1 hypothetical protein [Campylobacter sp.]
MSSIIAHHKQLLYTVPSPVCFKISGSSSFLEQFFYSLRINITI